MALTLCTVWPGDSQTEMHTAATYRNVFVSVLSSRIIIALEDISFALVCRYYADATSIGSFCGKISNQIILSCKAHIVRNGKLFEQPAKDVLASLDAVSQVHASFVQIFRYNH